MAKKTESKFPKPEDVEAKILEYNEACRKRGSFIDEAGMRGFIGLTKSEIAEMCDDSRTPNADEYIAVFERQADRRESALVRRMVTEPKSANGCMNALKQKANGGYTDKPVNADAPQTLNIHIVGGHGSELFK